MNDDFEDALKRWLRERGRTDRSALRALAKHVAVLPPRHRRRLEWSLLAVASLVVAVALASLALDPRTGSASRSPSPAVAANASPTGPIPTPLGSGLPDPNVFARSPWLEQCGGIGVALSAFVLPRARDLAVVLPAMLKSPEIRREEPAFVLVYQGFQPFGVRGSLPHGTATAPRPTLGPDEHDLCVIVGPVTGFGTTTIYSGVSFAGFDLGAAGPAVSPSLQLGDGTFPTWPGIPWTDRSGARVDPLVLAVFGRLDHCGWGGAAFLEIGWPLGSQALKPDQVRRYVRDPHGIFGQGYTLLDRLDLSAALPADAVGTGDRSGDIEVWTSPTTINRAIYLRWPDHVERWPRMENVVACG